MIHKKIASYIRSCFGGIFSVKEYLDDNDNAIVDILRCEGSPYEGVDSYSTIGLSDQLGFETADGKPFGVELIGAAHDAFDEFPNLLASAAIMVARHGIRCEPYAILEDVFSDYEISSTMSHMICVHPFLWAPHPESLDHGLTLTAWLQLLPISDSELKYVQSSGHQAMLDRLGATKYDILDLNRPCSVCSN